MDIEEKLPVEDIKEEKTVPKKKAIAVTLICILVTALLTVFGTISLINVTGYNGLGLDKEAWDKLKWGFSEVDSLYYGEVNKEKMVDGALTGLSLSLDEYSMYMNKENAEQFMQSVGAESYSGVGLYIYNNTDDDSVTVLSSLKNSPAEEMGIKTGDKIIAIEGKAIRGAELDSASEMMMGKEGTKVTVTVIKADTGKTEDYELVRREIQIETVYSELLEDNIGYIEITQFGTNTYTEFVEQYNSLVEKGMERLIIDLRNNSGGYFNQAINIADIFVDKGDLIVYTKDKSGKKEEYRAVTEAVDIDMVVLSNGGTASASEVLIGALRDNGKCVVVGEKSFGKGVTQAVASHKDGSIFKITDTKYYSPKGMCIHKKGFEPDVKVEEAADYDNILEAGIKAFD